MNHIPPGTRQTSHYTNPGIYGMSDCQARCCTKNIPAKRSFPIDNIESLFASPKEKNQTEGSIIDANCPSIPFSRLPEVQNGTVARLSKKIKKILLHNLEKPIRKLTSQCLSLTLEDFSDEGYEVPEKDLNKIIEGNRKLYTARNFRYHPVDGQLEIFKRLTPKSLVQIQRWLNPIKRIRLFDYEIYSDTTVLLDNIGSRVKIPVLTVDTFKRIVTIVRDIKKHTYKYLLEEKYPSEKRMWLGVENFRYITKFLDSLGNRDAHGLSVALNNFLDNLNETNRKLSALFDQAPEGKTWIQRLNKGTKDFIKSCPY
jgi:hypothetical protein